MTKNDVPAGESRPKTTEVNLEDAIFRKLDSYFEHLEGEDPMPLYELVRDSVERALLAYAMDRCGGKQLRAAKLLGLNRNTIHKKLVMHGLIGRPDDPPGLRDEEPWQTMVRMNKRRKG